MAYRDAGISPRSVGYVEAHGTATTVGDVVEVGALRKLFDEAGWTPRDGARTALGSVKANIGHTMSASGIAGLIKATLALHHKKLPPQPGVAEENPKLELGAGPFFLPKGEMPWQSGRAAAARRRELLRLRRNQRAPRPGGGAGGTRSVCAARMAEAAASIERSSSCSRGARASLVAKAARQLAAALPLAGNARGARSRTSPSRSRSAQHADARLAVVADSFERSAKSSAPRPRRWRSAATARAIRWRRPRRPRRPSFCPAPSSRRGRSRSARSPCSFPARARRRSGSCARRTSSFPRSATRSTISTPRSPTCTRASADRSAASSTRSPPPKRSGASPPPRSASRRWLALGLALHALLEKLGVKANSRSGTAWASSPRRPRPECSPEDAVRLVAQARARDGRSAPRRSRRDGQRSGARRNSWRRDPRNRRRGDREPEPPEADGDLGQRPPRSASPREARGPRRRDHRARSVARVPLSADGRDRGADARRWWRSSRWARPR